MNRDTAALNADSVPTIASGMVLAELNSSAASSSLVAGIADRGLSFSNVASKELLPLAGQSDQMNFNLQVGYGQSPSFAGSSSGSPEHSYSSGVAYLKQCNGFSMGSASRLEVDSPKRPGTRNQMNRAWYSPGGQPGVDSHGLMANRGAVTGGESRAAESKPYMDLTHPRRNETRRTSSLEKRTNTGDTQKPNLGEKKLVKILQRPSSVTKNHGPDIVSEQGSQDADASTSTHQRKGRKKTLSLNPDELEDLESLIEQVLKGGIEETNTDSEDEVDDMVAETDSPVKMSPDKKTATVGKGVDKPERETKPETAKSSAVIRNETGGKGRKFVKETGKNVGRGRDQGRRRENLKAKDNRRINDFQSRRINETAPVPAPPDDEKGKHNMTNVYPAQLKVALKHMDSLPPRFQRRLQTGMSQISGSDPALSKLMEETSPSEGRSISSSGGKDNDKSKDGRERGSRKTIRNLLNDLALYDEETAALPMSESVARRLSFQSGDIREPMKPQSLNSVQDTLTPLQPLNCNTKNMPLDRINSSKSPVIVNDQYRMRPPLFQPKQVEKVFMMNEAYIADPSNTDSSANYEKEFAQWRCFDRSATASPLSATRKTTFSVNAPEFVSTLFLSNPAPSRDLRGCGLVSGQPESVSALGFTTNASLTNMNQPLPSNMLGCRTSMVQPEYANVSSQQQTRYPMIPGLPVAANRGPTYLDPSFGPLAPVNGMIPRQRLMNVNVMPYSSVPMMPYDSPVTGYAPQLQHQQQMMPSLSNQSYVTAPASQLGDLQTQATTELTQMPWYAGSAQGPYMNAATSRQDAGLGSAMTAANPYDVRNMGVDGTGGWQKTYIQQPLPFEIGRQRVVRLMNEGNFVMVILIGRVDGGKLSMFSELQSSTSGALVLNLRNGLCPTSEEKLLEMHQWNYKLALEAMETQKNPIIIDHTFAQQWQMRDYIGLAQMNNYHVEIVDCDETSQFRGISNMGSYIWDDRQSMGSADNATLGGLNNRYNIPPIMNNTYYPPSASSAASLASQQQQQQQLVHSDQASLTLQNVMLPVPNV